MGESESPNRSKRPTVADVAARAGVSIGTVSHVLSGKRTVSPSTRERTLKAIADLGYRPNRIARSLMLRRTETIGMVVPDMANPFFGELMHGVELTAREWNYGVLFANSDNDVKLEVENIRRLLEMDVDGMLLSVAGDSGNVAEMIPESTPVIAVDRLPQNWPHPAVVSDNRHGLALAVAHLVEGGHRRVGFISGDRRVSTSREREEGFKTACEQHGVEMVWLGGGEFSLQCGYRVANELFQQPRGEWPTAVIGANDELALGLLKAAAERTIQIPDELAVIGNDDIRYAEIAMPPLTTVRQPVRELGVTAAILLYEMLTASDDQTHREEPLRRVVQPSLVVRASTTPR